MTKSNGMQRREESWWVVLPDGRTRRIWVRKASDQFHCAREICTVEQEAARTRLAAAEAAHEPLDPRDVNAWRNAIFDVSRTPDVSEAWTFLGADAVAGAALRAADPLLDDAFAATPRVVGA